MQIDFLDLNFLNYAPTTRLGRDENEQYCRYKKAAVQATPTKETEQAKEAALVKAQAENRVEYSFSGGLAARLAQMGASFALTSYQSGL